MECVMSLAHWPGETRLTGLTYYRSYYVVMSVSIALSKKCCKIILWELPLGFLG